MSLNRRYTWWWLIIIGLWIAVETAAILDPAAGDTFTEHIREWLQLYSRNVWTGRAFAVVFLGWLSWHFLYPKKPKK